MFRGRPSGARPSSFALTTVRPQTRLLSWASRALSRHACADAFAPYEGVPLADILAGMSSQNVELVRSGFEAWNRGDLQWMLDHLSSDWEWQTARLFPGTDPVYRGKEGFTRFWNSFREPWESIRVELEHVEELGDRVLALHTFHGTGKDSGVNVTVKMANLYTIQDGLCVHQIGYADWDSARRAAGLEG